jgi:hypothetical protein
MSTLVQQRCFNHFSREAVARCPECTRFFCRECVTEHDDRVVCAACLSRLTAVASRKRPRLERVARVTQLVCSLVIAWFFFFLVGEILVRLPDSFHEDLLWRSSWLNR